MINGKRIRVARESRGMTQAKLGKALGVSSVTIWRWEQNGVELGQSMLLELSAALDMPVTFFREDPISTPQPLGHQTVPKSWAKDGREACDNCNFYRDCDHGDRKVCRRFPTPVDVLDRGWCGEWELHEDYDDGHREP